MNVIIIDYGAGNIQSIQFALLRLGVTAVLSNNPELIQSADKLIFPGVGEASQAMKMLQNSKLDALIPSLKQEVLGICLGMQLLCPGTSMEIHCLLYNTAEMICTISGTIYLRKNKTLNSRLKNSSR